MADDTVWNYVNDFLTGRISRKQFWINLFHSSDIQRWFMIEKERNDYIECSYKEGKLLA